MGFPYMPLSHVQPFDPPPPLGSMCFPSPVQTPLYECATVASVDAYCPSIFHCCICRARNKRSKQKIKGT